VREDHYWPDWDSDSIKPAQQPRLAPLSDDGLATEILAGGVVSPGAPSHGKRVLGRVLMATGGVIAFAAILYTIDLISSAGDVPRGVVVAGVDVGGMSHADAEAKLRQELEPRLTQPVPVTAGDVQAMLDPVTSGLGLDWPATLARAGHQPLDPFTRITSFFVKRQVDVATKTDDEALNQAVSQFATATLNHPPTEGGIGFRSIPGSDGGVSAYPIEPRDGQTLNDIRAAANLLKARWLDKTGVRLVVDFTPVKATSAGVHAALDELVTPAVARPVSVHGNGADARLKPDAIAAAMRFAAQDNGTLQVAMDPAKLVENLQPQLATTEQVGKDAQIVFTDAGPTVQPSEDARKIDWNATFTPLMALLIRPEGRDLVVQYQTAHPAITTDDANGLGIKEVVGEFTTGQLSGAAAVNVRAMADKVNGAVVRPGQTFSLDTRTGPRTRAQGFVPAPLNEDGTGPMVDAGGISQFTTTLYNAAYFAGLTDAGHTEHPYYLDRYPAGRDAISLRADGSGVDLRFTDSLTSGLVIQAISSGPTVTVRIWGTRQFRVESASSGWRDVVGPQIEHGSGAGCQPSSGEPGFTTTDTRVRYDLATGAQVGVDTRVVRYDPKPIVFCA